MSGINAIQMAVIHLIIIVMSFIASLGYPRNTIVKVKEGLLDGITLTADNGQEFVAYLDVPYAEPPVGPLRFRSPVSAKPWSGILLANKNRKECPQGNETFVTGTEDCLYLNVYTPKFRHRKPLPVLVAIHGGAYSKGNGSSYGPTYLMRDSNIIYVNMNYRLGLLGYLSTGDDAAPSNNALKDQVLAMKWVQRNIGAFGGDPKRVTLMGHSSGSACVHLHTMSDMSAGLFHRYILQSGTALASWAYRNRTEHLKRVHDVAEHFRCSTRTSQLLADCLRQVPMEDLVRFSFADSLSPLYIDLRWRPTDECDVPGAFLTDSPKNLMKANKVRDLECITGNVNDEGLIASVSLYNHLCSFDIASILDDIFSYYLVDYVDRDVLNQTAKAFKKMYMGDVISDDKHVLLKQMTDFITDSQFLYPQVATLRYHYMMSRKRMYAYDFQYRGTFSYTSSVLNSNKNVGVMHGDELIYLFSPDNSVFGLPETEESPQDLQMSDELVEMWTNFVITGKPFLQYRARNDAWKPFSPGTGYLQIGNNSEPRMRMVSELREEQIEFWRRNINPLV